MVRQAVADGNGGVFAATPGTVVHLGPDGATTDERDGYANLSGLRFCGDRLVLTDVEIGTMQVLDPSTLQTLDDVTFQEARLLDCDDSQAWVANQSGGFVARLAVNP